MYADNLIPCADAGCNLGYEAMSANLLFCLMFDVRCFLKISSKSHECQHVFFYVLRLSLYEEVLEALRMPTFCFDR